VWGARGGGEVVPILPFEAKRQLNYCNNGSNNNKFLLSSHPGILKVMIMIVPVLLAMMIVLQALPFCAPFHQSFNMADLSIKETL